MTQATAVARGSVCAAWPRGSGYKRRDHAAPWEIRQRGQPRRLQRGVVEAQGCQRRTGERRQPLYPAHSRGTRPGREGKLCVPVGTATCRPREGRQHQRHPEAQQAVAYVGQRGRAAGKSAGMGMHGGNKQTGGTVREGPFSARALLGLTSVNFNTRSVPGGIYRFRPPGEEMQSRRTVSGNGSEVVDPAPVPLTTSRVCVGGARPRGGAPRREGDAGTREGCKYGVT